MAGEVTVINVLKRQDQLVGGPVLPVVDISQVSGFVATVNPFVVIEANQYGTHPLFLSQTVLNAYLLTLVTGLGSSGIPTTYTGTQSYTASCGTGFSGLPITRSVTRTSTVNQSTADSLALAAATTLANSLLVCTVTVVTYQATIQSYTTTTSDYTTKCGAGTSGSAVTRTSTTGTSTVSQAAANTLALQDATQLALAAIVCPIPAPTFNTTLNPTTPGNVAGAVTYNGVTGSLFKFNTPLSTNTAPNPATMLLFFPAGTQVGQVDYSGFDSGVACALLLNGVLHTTIFTNGSVTLT